MLQAFVKATAKGPKVRCRILLDSESQCTFIRTELAKIIQARPIWEQILDLATFGQNEATKRCNKYSVKHSHLEGGEETEMGVLEVPNITSLRNVYPEVIKDSYTHLRKIPSQISSHVDWS